MTKHKKYVVHYCKHPKCNNAWIDEDLTNAQSRPPKWKNCKSCSEVLGIDFDAQIRPKKKLSEKQKEVLQKNKFHKRKKSSLLDKNTNLNINGGKNEY